MGSFDHIHHAILLKLLKRRIRDPRILTLIHAMLKAGVMEGGLFQHTPEGTPQGGILSPLLANIYLHEFDRWWWESYGQFTPYQKHKRRKAGVGNCSLTRYADDFVLLCNGPHAEALRLREEARQTLWERLHLELALEKTQVTHATEGFDFLGFHIRYHHPRTNKPWLRVTPSRKSIQRLRDTIKTLTKRPTFYQTPLEKFRSINRVLRGWNQYYEYANATTTASKLTYWANDRLFRWLRKRHKRSASWIERRYRQRERQGRHERWNLGVRDEKGEMVYLYQLTDLHRRQYRARLHLHPYLLTLDLSELPTEDSPFVEAWDGQTTLAKAAWASLRLAILERDKYRCTKCGATSNLHIHHRQERRHGGTDAVDNLQTICADCHMHTTEWGRPRGVRNRLSRKAG